MFQHNYVQKLILFHLNDSRLLVHVPIYAFAGSKIVGARLLSYQKVFFFFFLSYQNVEMGLCIILTVKYCKKNLFLLFLVLLQLETEPIGVQAFCPLIFLRGFYAMVQYIYVYSGIVQFFNRNQ